jgi:GT2 family glycosyltransferase
MAATSRPGPAAVEATWCGELELSGSPELRGVSPFADEAHARVLVRLHGEPLGYVTVPAGAAGVDAAAVAADARTRFAAAVTAHLAQEHRVDDGGPLPAAGEGCPNRVDADVLVSVVVCTRDRADQLAGCLDRLRLLTYPRLEVVVVDNAPPDDATQRVVEAVQQQDPRFRYVREPRPGLSAARNKGLAEARGTVLAYTDDDVAVDPDWVQGVLRGFARRPDVGCVTGLVCTASISSPAEEYFDARTSLWSTRVEPQLFDLRGSGPDDPLYPYAPGLFGTGANIAFDRQLLLDLGGFDEALGAGTRTRGGEDLDIFVRVLRAGRALVYEPAAIVWHHHRADEDALLSQLYGYGTGLSAYLTKCLLQRETRAEILRRVVPGLRRRRAISDETSERLGGTAAAPPGAARRELQGLLVGPVLYLRARRSATTPTVTTDPAAAGSSL